MDQNHAAHEAFHTSHQQLHIPAPATSHILMASQPAQAAPATRFAHSNPSLDNPVPMDIDATWPKTKATDCKGNCSRVGHGAECGAERGTSRGSKGD